MYLWWSLCTFYLLACQVTVTVRDSGLCCCVPCLSSAVTSLRFLIRFTSSKVSTFVCLLVIPGLKDTVFQPSLLVSSCLHRDPQFLPSECAGASTTDSVLRMTEVQQRGFRFQAAGHQSAWEQDGTGQHPITGEKKSFLKSEALLLVPLMLSLVCGCI